MRRLCLRREYNENIQHRQSKLVLEEARIVHTHNTKKRLELHQHEGISEQREVYDSQIKSPQGLSNDEVQADAQEIQRLVQIQSA